MYLFFAFAFLNAYSFDLAVWLMIGAVFIACVLALIKRAKLFAYVLGLILLLTSLPAAFTTEVSNISSRPMEGSGQTGVGYIFGILVAAASITVLVLARKLNGKH